MRIRVSQIGTTLRDRDGTLGRLADGWRSQVWQSGPGRWVDFDWDWMHECREVPYHEVRAEWGAAPFPDEGPVRLHTMAERDRAMVRLYGRSD